MSSTTEKARSVRYYARHPDRVTAARRRRYQRDKAKQAAEKAAQRAADPEKFRRQGWYARRLPEPTRPRPALCECCGRLEQVKAVLALDHNHITGRFRGWLCHHCNVGIGALGDTVDGVLSALNYLVKNP